ncbi:MAG: hypothetical protein N2Z22_05045 [Turneriella sp.]|nr:hypothetical protein [Turneriella sp.]
MPANALYSDFHTIDLTPLRTKLLEGKIPPQLAQDLLGYWQHRLGDKKDAIYSQYLEYYLFFESVRALFLAVFVIDLRTHTTRHSYGIFPALEASVQRALATAPNSESGALDFEHAGHHYRLHYFRTGYHEEQLVVAALAFADADVSENLRRMRYVLERYYLPSIFSRDERLRNLFAETQNLIAQWINPVLARRQPVTFTYLHFESLAKYAAFAGEHFARELILELQQDVHRILKDIDRSVILSTREILIVSANCEEEVLRKRFAGAYFHAKSLLMAYDVHFFCLREPVVDMHTIWDQITGNIPYRKKVADRPVSPV